ncbi:MAG TPA: hypothetical protein VGL29_24655 [Blastocatellia bacterium]
MEDQNSKSDAANTSSYVGRVERVPPEWTQELDQYQPTELHP